MKKITLALALLITCLNTSAKYHNEVGLLLGMSMINITEKDPGLNGENIADPESVGFSSISLSGYYKFLPMRRSSFYTTATFPMAMIGGQDTYFSGGIGYEYYFNKGAHLYTSDAKGMKINLLTKLRYFALAELDLSYAAYTTSVSKKTDTFIEFKGGGGLSYAINKDFCIRSTATFAFGAGLGSTPMVIQVLVGGTIFLPN